MFERLCDLRTRLLQIRRVLFRLESRFSSDKARSYLIRVLVFCLKWSVTCTFCNICLAVRTRPLFKVRVHSILSNLHNT